MGRILVYFDGKEGSEKALRKAEDIMDKEEDEIMVLTVVPKVKIEGVEGLSDEKVKGLRDALNGQLETLKARKIKCRGFFEHGNIVDTIVNMAQYFEVNLVILTHQKEEKLSPFTVGSISEQVSKRIHRPIMLIE